MHMSKALLPLSGVSCIQISPCIWADMHRVLQCVLHMPQFEFALRTAESTAKVQNLGQNWGMCSTHCDTSGMLHSKVHQHSEGVPLPGNRAECRQHAEMRPPGLFLTQSLPRGKAPLSPQTPVRPLKQLCLHYMQVRAELRSRVFLTYMDAKRRPLLRPMCAKRVHFSRDLLGVQPSLICSRAAICLLMPLWYSLI